MTIKTETQNVKLSGHKIDIPTFLEVYSAMHFSPLVPSPVQDRSGMMVVAPSGSLKTSLLMHLSRNYQSVVSDSNWHYGKLLKMRAAFFNNSVRSIVIPELSSLYAGDPRTGGRCEALFQQMAGEGSISTNEQDSRFQRYEMRAMIFAALTPEFAAKHHASWEEGFHRRFVWVHLAMENEEVLLDYLTAGKQADMIVNPIVEPPERFIPNNLKLDDRMFVRSLLKDQKDFGPNHTRFNMMCKTAAVLMWQFERTKSKKNWRHVLKDFSVCMSDKAALLVIPDEPETQKYRKEIERKELSKYIKRKRKSQTA